MAVTITGFRVRHLAAMRSAEYARRVPAARRRLGRLFEDDLRRLHDAVDDTALNGRYWLWSGLLLGWAREGAVLAHDSTDGDFAVADEDFGRLVDAVPEIVRAGFTRDRCFRNNDGVVTELTFMRHGTRFDFFRLFPEDTQARYFMYSIKWKGILEVEASIPWQAKVPFEFLGRTWLKSADHELELRSMYGNWRVPDPSWSYLDSLDIESKRPSRYSHFDWRRTNGPAGGAGVVGGTGV